MNFEPFVARLILNYGGVIFIVLLVIVLIALFLTGNIDTTVSNFSFPTVIIF